mmetsp:Transcript_43878/g.67328  ORF Transcript_43878/g.67328 Transcript_43878/m.67328 type:complete len:93 (+) Transcript_43878:267-545(+)
MATILLEKLESTLTLEEYKALGVLCLQKATSGRKLNPQVSIDLGVLLCQRSGFSTKELFPECPEVELINNSLRLLRSKSAVGFKRSRSALGD